MTETNTKTMVSGTPDVSRRRRLSANISATPTYAIGDVHGRLDLLEALEEKIFRDAEKLPGEKLIVMLGDYIDRGPDSARVISHLMKPIGNDFYRICLAGNHEAAMVSYIDGSITLEQWNSLGAETTLHSYGLDPDYLSLHYAPPKKLDEFIRGSLPPEHIAFLRDLPIMLDTPQAIFVHAGIDPTRTLDAQDDEDLMYIRSRFFNSKVAPPRLVVHGHTPVGTPEAARLRLNIDTGAVRTGRLTAARLWRGRIHLTST